MLGEDRAATFAAVYDVTEAGNFEKANILNLPKSIAQFAKLRGLDESNLQAQLAEDRAKLFAVRAKRVRPSLDDKVILSWNALTISAMVKGYRALGEDRFLQAATKTPSLFGVKCGATMADCGTRGDWGKATLDAYLDDYSYLIDGLPSCFRSTAIRSCRPGRSSWQAFLTQILRIQPVGTFLLLRSMSN